MWLPSLIYIYIYIYIYVAISISIYEEKIVIKSAVSICKDLSVSSEKKGIALC